MSVNVKVDTTLGDGEGGESARESRHVSGQDLQIRSHAANTPAPHDQAQTFEGQGTPVVFQVRTYPCLA